MAKKPTLSNLKPFKKGQSGNPNGRPRKLPSLDVLLADVLGEEREGGQTSAEKILKALRKKAEAGDIRAAEALLDRKWGKPTQRTETQQLDEHGNPMRPETNTIIIAPPK